MPARPCPARMTFVGLAFRRAPLHFFKQLPLVTAAAYFLASLASRRDTVPLPLPSPLPFSPAYYLLPPAALFTLRCRCLLFSLASRRDTVPLPLPSPLPFSPAYYLLPPAALFTLRCRCLLSSFASRRDTVPLP
jgi:hypothetical protein